MGKKNRGRAQKWPTFEQLESNIKELGVVKKDIVKVRKHLEEFLSQAVMSSGNVSKQPTGSGKK